MTYFELELKKGNFMISECIKCNQITWPPSDYCSNCFRKTDWKKSNGIGTIIEFSKNNDVFFGLVELEKNVRVVGTIKPNSKHPDIHKKVKLENCHLIGNNHSFSFVMI